MDAKDKQRLYDAYNATSTDDPEGSDQLETYEAWLERQLLSRMNKESYASQQMPSEELIKEQYKETVCRIKNYTKCPYYNDFREGCLDCKYHRLT